MPGIRYRLRCGWCRAWMEKTDLYQLWTCACGFYVEGKHFDQARGVKHDQTPP